MSEPFRGVFTIPFTPIHENHAVDWPVCDGSWIFASNAARTASSGRSTPANLQPDRRRTRQGMQVVTEQVAGRIPVVLGYPGRLCRTCRLPQPPRPGRRRRRGHCHGAVRAAAGQRRRHRDYYQAIDAEWSAHLCPESHAWQRPAVKLLARLVDEVEQVTYIKEETFPVTHMVTQVREACGPKIKGSSAGRAAATCCWSIHEASAVRCPAATSQM